MRQDKTQQPAIEAPEQAVLLIALTFTGIQPPAEAGALQRLGDLPGIVGAQLLHGLQAWVRQQLIQSTGGEASSGKLQNLQQRHGEPRTALLAAVGEAPWQLDPDRRAVVEHRAQQRGIPFDLRRHHQHIPRGQAGVSRQPLQDLIPHQLDFAKGAGGGEKQQRAIFRCSVQQLSVITLHQLLLQLFEQ